MQGTVHLLVGVAVAVLVPHTPSMFVLAFFSHYVLDALPHIDPETFSQHSNHYSLKQKIGLTADVVLVLTLMAAIFIVQHRSAHILLGAIAGQAPDLLIPLERYSFFAPIRRFHFMIHWNEALAQRWSWYLTGIFTPLAIGLASLFIIWQY